jgi:hypothetical protein
MKLTEAKNRDETKVKWKGNKKSKKKKWEKAIKKLKHIKGKKE